MNEKAILIGPCIGELGWEFMRFSPILPYYYKQYHKKNVKFIIMTRPDRFDMYGQYADIFVPLRIEGDGTQFKADCFRLLGYKSDDYLNLIKRFRKQYKKRFEIIEHIYPKFENKQFANKRQFPPNKMIFKWKPRIENKNLISQYLPDDKPLIILAPRFRKGLRRNWNGWPLFFDLISNKEIIEKYNFVICGKNPDYVPDIKDRFYDINKIKLNNEISTIGLTIECIKRSILVIGSQSAIPNMSMLMGIETLEWGHQKDLHSRVYNIKKTPVHFIEDMNYKLDPKIIFDKMVKILRKK